MAESRELALRRWARDVAERAHAARERYCTLRVFLQTVHGHTATTLVREETAMGARQLCKRAAQLTYEDFAFVPDENDPVISEYTIGKVPETMILRRHRATLQQLRALMQSNVWDAGKKDGDFLQKYTDLYDRIETLAFDGIEHVDRSARAELWKDAPEAVLDDMKELQAAHEHRRTDGRALLAHHAFEGQLSEPTYERMLLPIERAFLGADASHRDAITRVLMHALQQKQAAADYAATTGNVFSNVPYSDTMSTPELLKAIANHKTAAVKKLNEHYQRRSELAQTAAEPADLPPDITYEMVIRPPKPGGAPPPSFYERLAAEVRVAGRWMPPNIEELLKKDAAIRRVDAAWRPIVQIAETAVARDITYGKEVYLRHLTAGPLSHLINILHAVLCFHLVDTADPLQFDAALRMRAMDITGWIGDSSVLDTARGVVSEILANSPLNLVADVRRSAVALLAMYLIVIHARGDIDIVQPTDTEVAMTHFGVWIGTIFNVLGYAGLASERKERRILARNIVANFRALLGSLLPFVKADDDNAVRFVDNIPREERYDYKRRQRDYFLGRDVEPGRVDGLFDYLYR